MAEATAILDLLLTARYIGGPAFRTMAGDIDGLVAKSNTLTKLGGAFNLIGDAMLGVGVAATIGLGVAASKAMAFEQGLTRIQSVTGYSKGQMDSLKQTIFDLSDKYGISSNSIVDGSYFILSGVQSLGAGYQDVVNAQILPALAAYVEASGAGRLGSIDFAQAAQDLPHILAGMHEPINNWKGDLADLLVAENNAALSQQQLVSGFTRFAPTGGFLGMDFAQTTSLVAALASSSVVGARSGTELAAGLRNMFVTKGGEAEATKLGISPDKYFDKQGNLTNMMGLLDATKVALNKISDPTARFGAATSLFGATGGRAFLELMKPGANGAPGGLDIAHNILKSEGTPGMAYDRMLQVAQAQAQGPQAQWDIFKQRLENTAIVIGDKVLPVLLQFAQYVGELSLKFRAFIEAHPEAIALALKAIPGLLLGGVGMKLAGGVLGFLGSPAGKGGLTVAGKLLGSVGDHEAGFVGPMLKGETRASGLLGMFGGAGRKGAGLGERLGGLPGKGIGKLLEAGAKEGEASTLLEGGKLHKGMSLPEKLFGKAARDKGLLHLTNKMPNAFMGFGEESALKAEQGVGHPVLGFMGGAAKDVGGGIAGGFGKLAGGLKGLLGGIPALLGLLPELAGGFLAVLGPVMLIVGVIAILVLTFLKFRKEAENALGLIGKGLTPIFQLFGAIVQSAMSAIGNAWNSAWPAIHDAMEGLFKNLPKITPMLQFFGVILGGIALIVVAVAVGIIKGFINMLAPIINVISGIISLVGSFFLILKGIFTLNGDEIKQGLHDAWEAIKQIIGNALLAIWNMITGIFGGIGDFIGGVWDKITGKHKDGTSKAHAVIKQHLDTTSTDTHTAYSNMTTDTNTQMTNMANNSNTTLQGMNTDTASWMNQINTGSTDQLTQMATNGCDQFGNLQNCVSNHLDQTAVIAKQKTQAITRAVKDNLPQPDDITAVGERTGNGLMDGITRGINERQKQAEQAADNAAYAINQAFKDKMKISSPSRVFMEHGQNMMAGLSLGIRSGMGGPQSTLSSFSSSLGSHFGSSSPLVGALQELTNAMQEGPGSGSDTANWTYEASCIRDRRLRNQDSRMPVTNSSLRDKLDLAYRGSYQKTQ